MDGSKITVHQMGGAFAVEGPSCTSSKMSPADTEPDLIASASFLCSVNRPIRLETTYRTAKENTRNPMVRMILEQIIVRNWHGPGSIVVTKAETCPADGSQMLSATGVKPICSTSFCLTIKGQNEDCTTTL